MKKILALTGVLYAPLALVLVGAAVPQVLGILLALLRLGSNIGLGLLASIFSDLIFFPGGFLSPSDFVFLL